MKGRLKVDWANLPTAVDFFVALITSAFYTHLGINWMLAILLAFITGLVAAIPFAIYVAIANPKQR